MKEIKVGNITGKVGEIVYDYLEILEHPVGTIERLPVIIAQGANLGPTLWLTGNIHGNEYTGIPVIHRVINNLNLEELKGTVVAIPTLNPAGSRVKTRYPYYDRKDPNRLFPDGNPFKEKPKAVDAEVKEITIDEEKEDELLIKTEKIVKISVDKETEEPKIEDPLAKYDNEELYPSVQELIWKNLFELIKETADYLLDLHNAFIKSIPFCFIDRVLYNPDVEDDKKKAEDLYNRTEEMVRAFGLTIVRETTPTKYIQKKLHRSTSGAALNFLRIPSFTVELGMYLDIEPEVVDAATVGVFNVLKWAKMLNGRIEKITSIPVIAENEAVRYIGHPRTKKSAIIDLKIKKGDFVKKGDVVAVARDIFGRPVKDEFEIKTEVDGYVFMINEGILRYPNEEICWLASPDTQPMVDKWPKKSSK
ncbi:MAG: succinylglutamate desuccinylase/aspartoacylase family protein [Asgard group archaeon]|nr:succinylglutamate desuccinylase/aspartoacylase family protein [Asgard group archaeon]